MRCKNKPGSVRPQPKWWLAYLLKKEVDRKDGTTASVLSACTYTLYQAAPQALHSFSQGNSGQLWEASGAPWRAL